jgi:photosystem II stability/assembly factor-like uncharacterized protein
MSPIRRRLAAVATSALCVSAPLAWGAAFVDPLTVPAQVSPLAQKSLLQSVAKAGARFVAVGQRGHILYSDDSGATWTQAKVPVSSDLTAVTFVDDKKGWAVGHDGVILHSADGGQTWTLQLEGRQANELLLTYMQNQAAAKPQSTETTGLLDEAKRFKEQGSDKPFLDVWFADANNGYVVGAYNLIFRTSDGGKTWEPLFDETDNPKLLNFYAIRPVGGDIYIAGEAGLVLKLDRDAKRFRAQSLPYKGSYFGVTGDKSAVVVFGLRGNVFRSADGGGSWQKVEAGLPAAITAGAILGDGTIVLADAGGRYVQSSDSGRTFSPAAVERPLPVSGIADAGNRRVVQAGVAGVSVAELKPR